LETLVIVATTITKHDFDSTDISPTVTHFFQVLRGRLDWNPLLVVGATTTTQCDIYSFDILPTIIHFSAEKPLLCCLLHTFPSM
jgi:hypothetical protein